MHFAGHLGKHCFYILAHHLVRTKHVPIAIVTAMFDLSLCRLESVCETYIYPVADFGNVGGFCVVNAWGIKIFQHVVFPCEAS